VLVGLFGMLMAGMAACSAFRSMPYKIPILGFRGLNHIPLVIAGVAHRLFSIEHILALIAGKKVVPAWH
jgi:hypothetical protein